MRRISEKFEGGFYNEKYSPEDIRFFNNLVEKYDIDQNLEELIIKRGDRETHILKNRKIFIKGKGLLKIEDYVKEVIDQLEKETKTDKKEEN